MPPNKFIVDFHIHSHFSLATSKNLIPEYLEYWAAIKGINVVGTGDCIHPGWFAELNKKLILTKNGLYKLKKEYKLKNPALPAFDTSNIYFLPTTEISCIYKKNGKVRKVHNLLVFPNFEAVEKLQKKLDKIGNIRADGRPILGLDSKTLLELTLECSESAFLIPAHIWTPWFSALGSKSGFNSISECYEDLTKYIFAVETGLSSDPAMNWRCSFLDEFALVSNSDAHSPEKLGREANLFAAELTYENILTSLKNHKKKDSGFLGTIEFFPEEGKYHFDGHRKCSICWTPEQTIEHNGLCSICGKEVTKGVLYRINELADRRDIITAPYKKKFNSITPLRELIAELHSKSSSSKIVTADYFKLIQKLGNEFGILLDVDYYQLKKTAGELFAEGIKRLRENRVFTAGGYDGEFGKIRVFEESELKTRGAVLLAVD